MSSRVFLLALAVSLTGCYSFEMSRVGRNVAHDLEAQTGADVGGGLSMSVGPVSLASAQFGAWVFAPNSTREARQIGRHVSSLKFSRRAIRGGFDGRNVLRPEYLERYTRNGWYSFVTVRDSSSAAWIMMRERGHNQQITNFLAVIMAEEDLVIAKISGNLSDLIREAIEMGVQEGVLGDALQDAGLIEDDTPEASGDNEALDANP